MEQARRSAPPHVADPRVEAGPDGGDARRIVRRHGRRALTGCEQHGGGKQCFYEALGNEYTRTIGSVELCPLSIQVQSRRAPTSDTQERVVTAFKTGERTTGMTKQCYYDALGSEYTRTIKSVELCPLTIKVRPGSS